MKNLDAAARESAVTVRGLASGFAQTVEIERLTGSIADEPLPLAAPRIQGLCRYDLPAPGCVRILSVDDCRAVRVIRVGPCRTSRCTCVIPGCTPLTALNAKRKRDTSTALSGVSSSAVSWLTSSAQGSSNIGATHARFTWTLVSRRSTSVHRKRSPTNVRNNREGALRTLL